MSKYLFSSESVTEGHPDKLCDQIADAILDDMLAKDPYARVACEVMATTGIIFVAGEVTTNAYCDIETIVRNTIKDIGYDRAKYGFDCETCAVVTSISSQSPDIAMGVDTALEKRVGSDDYYDTVGSGDQGIVFGFACDETESYMPLPIDLAHKLVKRLADVRKDGTIPYLRPDGKSQVTVEYDGYTPIRVDTILIAAQHSPEITNEQIEKDIFEHVIKHVIPQNLMDADTKCLINTTGRFTIGGPKGDTGLTGRKIIVDTYGGYGYHGGGAFSGKDPTKMDRAGSYMARYAAKNVVAAGLAKRCEIQIGYAIGKAHPLSVYVTSYGTSKLSDEELTAEVIKRFDFRPGAIIAKLDLRRPIYKQCAAYGHFGRTDLDLPWERIES